MARARYHLAQAYLRKGNAEAAKAQFREFLEIWKHADPDLPELVEVRRRMGAVNLISSNPRSSSAPE